MWRSSLRESESKWSSKLKKLIFKGFLLTVPTWSSKQKKVLLDHVRRAYWITWSSKQKADV